jgi:predicted GNAT superfamily acetyltransferase
MAKDKIRYTIVEGVPDALITMQLVELYHLIFEDADIPFFKKRIHEQINVISILAFNKEQLVGFKIGYHYNPQIFYSWVGGVHTSFRQKGIGSVLLEMQSSFVKRKGYKKLRTKSMNRFKPMIIMNLKNGFDIIQVYTNKIGQTKIIFEKSLEQIT